MNNMNNIQASFEEGYQAFTATINGVEVQGSTQFPITPDSINEFYKDNELIEMTVDQIEAVKTELMKQFNASDELDVDIMFKLSCAHGDAIEFYEEFDGVYSVAAEGDGSMKSYVEGSASDYYNVLYFEEA